MQEDDDNQNLVLGILFGVIALVIGLVIGLASYVTGQTREAAPAAVAAVEAPEIAEVGEPLIKLYFDSGKAELPANAAEEVAKARALAVKDALIAAGIPADKVNLRKPAITLGGGEAAEARRVEVRVQ